MADPNVPRVKKEPSPSPSPPPAGTTTIGGVVRTSFAPKIPPRRKAGEGAAAAGGAGSANLSDLITVKEEKKYVPRARLSSTAAPSAARVAFQPSQPGASSSGMSSGSGDVADSRDVAIIVTHAPSARIPGQDDEAVAERKSRAAKAPGAAAAGGASAGAAGADGMEVDGAGGVEIEDADAADAADEAELAGMLASESSYDSFLDNGDLVQYRPILLPFPKVRLGVGAGAGRSSTVQRNSAVPSPMGLGLDARPASSQSGVASMFDIDEDAHDSAAAARSDAAAAARSSSPTRSASPIGASYKVFPSHTPARLLCQIDYEEKAAEQPSQNILFFQFPSHLPFKQSASWAPPVNPLLSLHGNRQTSLGANTSAVTFGANIEMGSAHSGGGGGGMAAAAPRVGAGAAAAGAPSPSLQALQNISSPMLPPIAGLGMPNFSLGHSATPSAAGTGGVGVGGRNNAAGGGGSLSGLMDSVGTSSALSAEEEQDLGEVAKSDPTKLSESERLAREHKARQARKLLLYSSNFEHAMRHLPSGQLGSLVIYKSGKIKMRIGDILLDVNEGVQCLFHQELMSVQPGTGEAFRLGAVNHRLVCTNDVEDLVRKTRERAVPTTNA